MKKQGEYDNLIKEFNEKKSKDNEALKLKKLDISKMKTSFHYPDEIKTVGLYYLKYSRNAWHSTWVTYYHPGDIHHELQSLKNRAEELRTPGSQFKIETREALWVKFKYSNVLIFQVNTVSDFYYSSALKSIKDGNLKDFWITADNLHDNWLHFFELGEWRPDLITKRNPERHSSFVRGSNKSLGWTEEETSYCPSFSKFVLEVSKRTGMDRL